MCTVPQGSAVRVAQGSGRGGQKAKTPHGTLKILAIKTFKILKAFFAFGYVIGEGNAITVHVV